MPTTETKEFRYFVTKEESIRENGGNHQRCAFQLDVARNKGRCQSYEDIQIGKMFNLGTFQGCTLEDMLKYTPMREVTLFEFVQYINKHKTELET